VTSEVLTTLLLKVEGFWDMALCHWDGNWSSVNIMSYPRRLEFSRLFLFMCVCSLLATFLQYEEPSVKLKTCMLCLYHQYLEINRPAYYSNNILGVLCMSVIFLQLYCVCVCVCVCVCMYCNKTLLSYVFCENVWWSLKHIIPQKYLLKQNKLLKLDIK